jgi:hypothetical protein
MTTTTKPKPRTPVPSAPPADLDLGDMLTRLFGAEPTGWLRLRAQEGDALFQPAGPLGWTAPRRPDGAALTAWEFYTALTSARWVPVLYGTPTLDAAVAQVPAVWCVWERATTPAAGTDDRRVAPTEEAATLAKVPAALPPTILLDEGVRLTGFWRLDQPLGATLRTEALLARLATTLGGAGAAARLAPPITCAIPNTLTDCWPLRWVRAEPLGPATVTVEAIEAMLAHAPVAPLATVPMRRRVVRDARGLIAAVIDEPIPSPLAVSDRDEPEP